MGKSKAVDFIETKIMFYIFFSFYVIVAENTDMMHVFRIADFLAYVGKIHVTPKILISC